MAGSGTFHCLSRCVTPRRVASLRACGGGGSSGRGSVISRTPLLTARAALSDPSSPRSRTLPSQSVRCSSSSSSSSKTSSPPAWLSKVLADNESWCSGVCQSQPDLLPKLSKGQAPEILWFGCSDSRVPETTILGLQPGDVFVHRNIANVLHSTDLSSLSVIEYAVVYLKVKHIIVCGHTSCGGVAAALGNKRLGKIDTWLMPLRKARMEHADKLAGLDEAARARKLVELNVLQSVETVRENPDVIAAIKERGDLDVTGLVYDISTGKLQVVSEEGGDFLEKVRLDAFETT